MTPTLTGGRATARSMMVDACTVTWDAEREVDDVLDPVTLVLSPPVGDSAVVYAGPCLVSPILSHREGAEGFAATSQRRYRVRLPHDAPAVPVGSLVTVTASADAALVGDVLRVVDAPAATLVVTRILVCEHDQGRPE